MSYTTLVDTDTLAAHLRDERWVLIDCRHDLGNPDAGRKSYDAGHIPGAHFMRLDVDLSSPSNGRNGRHPLPDPQVLAKRLGELGITKGVQVVAYDDQGGMFAARLWWLLNWLGHSTVALLNGGLSQWLKEARPLSSETPSPQPAVFNVESRSIGVSVSEVLESLRTNRALIVDARSADRYRGENETMDPIGGHIPGALNRFFKNNLDAQGRFKSAEILRAEWEALLQHTLPEQVVHQCGSGITACHNALAMEIAGLRGSRLYPGSWSEWCTDSTRPVARGPTPSGT
ncbi:MAG TPA: sulfurtransferase [Burkholderiales bacterium]|nr:sulfurtransferase [Burkholderiales bacterium]